MAGGAPTPHERFFPDYMDSIRPVLSAAPATLNYGGSFSITTPNASDITEVFLLRSGAVTHGFNMSQRGLELVVTALGAGSITVAGPPNANLAPPGWYLLFILNASKIPSAGRWVRVTA